MRKLALRRASRGDGDFKMERELRSDAMKQPTVLPGPQPQVTCGCF